MSNSKPSFATVRDLRKMLQRRTVSSVELTRDALERLQALGPRYRAVVELTSDLALRDARSADAKLRRGLGGPLCGVPYGAKDLLATKGIPTRWGAYPYRSQVFEYDATAIARARAAGAVLVAKLALISLAGAGGYRSAAASITGATANPWDMARWSGGSSSGSAAAVAAGLLPFTLGSETGGSILVPSSFCGVSGFRPSYGAVSRHGSMAVAWSCDKIGPLARTADDCETVFAAIAGYDPRDPTTVEVTYRRSRRRIFRVGQLPWGFSGFPDTERAFVAALRTLRRSGMIVRRAKLASYDFRGIYRTIQAGETAAAHRDLIQNDAALDLLDEHQRSGLLEAGRQPAANYARACEERVAATRAVRQLFRAFDVLLAPTVQGEAPAIDADLGEWTAGDRPQQFHYGPVGAVAGVPGLSIPIGFARSGLPLGMTVLADVGKDRDALQFGRVFQQLTDWHSRHP